MGPPSTKSAERHAKFREARLRDEPSNSTLDDVVKEIRRLRNDHVGGIGDTFWGVAFGVPLVLIIILIVAAAAGVAISGT